MRTHSPTDGRSTSFDPLCRLLDRFDSWHLAVGGVVLQGVADPSVPGVAVLFGLVVAAAEWCDGFGDGRGQCPGS